LVWSIGMRQEGERGRRKSEVQVSHSVAEIGAGVRSHKSNQFWGTGMEEFEFLEKFEIDRHTHWQFSLLVVAIAAENKYSAVDNVMPLTQYGTFVEIIYIADSPVGIGAFSRRPRSSALKHCRPRLSGSGLKQALFFPFPNLTGVLISTIRLVGRRLQALTRWHADCAVWPELARDLFLIWRGRNEAGQMRIKTHHLFHLVPSFPHLFTNAAPEPFTVFVVTGHDALNPGFRVILLRCPRETLSRSGNRLGLQHLMHGHRVMRRPHSLPRHVGLHHGLLAGSVAMLPYWSPYWSSRGNYMAQVFWSDAVPCAVWAFLAKQDASDPRDYDYAKFSSCATSVYPAQRDRQLSLKHAGVNFRSEQPRVSNASETVLAFLLRCASQEDNSLATMIDIVGPCRSAPAGRFHPRPYLSEFPVAAG
ncbi:hypothetical protein KCU88_g428, partial [Aureobasidium melanogenum]